MNNIFRSKSLVLGLIGAFILFWFPLEGLSQDEENTGAIVGHVYASDFKTPVEKAVVKIRNIETNKEYKSEPTDKEGIFRILFIEEGRYVLGVITRQGDFNFNFEIFIKAEEIAQLSLALSPDKAAVPIKPGQKPKRGFFATPVGIMLLVASTAALAVGTYAFVTEADARSPSKRKK